MPNEKILIISDFSAAEVNGGAEMNDAILRKELNCDFVKCCDFGATLSGLVEYDLYIVSNFYFLSEESKQFLADKKYVIIEHDYKFLPRRNPAEFPNFTAPPEIIINKAFYQNAAKVIVQSQLQKSLFDRNIELTNLTTFSANLWSDEDLDYIELIETFGEKNGRALIMDSPNYVKGTPQSVEYAESLRIKYDLVPPMAYREFLERMNRYSALIFMPQSPETLSRVVVEARMLNLVVLTSDSVGAVHESFYKAGGNSIINYMRDAKKELCRQLRLI
jgi:hypothetical protein